MKRRIYGAGNKKVIALMLVPQQYLFCHLQQFLASPPVALLINQFKQNQTNSA